MIGRDRHQQIGDDVSELVRYSLAEGDAEILVEVETPPSGVKRAARRKDGAIPAPAKLDDQLGKVVPVAQRVLDKVKDMGPSGGQVEFGIKLSAETGVILAKAGGEAHLTVTLSWGK
jgi:hypothetical protein